MSVPATKEELLQAIETNYNKLNKELQNISDEIASTKNMEGHSKDTVMTVNNLLAYLIGWGKLVLKWNEKRTLNQPVDFPETGYKWNELGKLAQKFYEDSNEDDFQSLKQKLYKNVADIITLVRSKTDEELYKTDWYGKWTLGRMIQFNTSSPYKNATARIRKLIKSLPSTLKK